MSSARSRSRAGCRSPSTGWRPPGGAPSRSTSRTWKPSSRQPGARKDSEASADSHLAHAFDERIDLSAAFLAATDELEARDVHRVGILPARADAPDAFRINHDLASFGRREPECMD